MLKHIIVSGLAATAFAFVTPAFAHGTKNLTESLRKDFGNDWTITSTGEKVTAVKKGTSSSGNVDKMKLDNELKDVEKGDVKAKVDGSTVSVNGTSDDCKELASQLKDIAKLDGIKRFEIDVRCSEKKT